MFNAQRYTTTKENVCENSRAMTVSPKIPRDNTFSASKMEVNFRTCHRQLQRTSKQREKKMKDALIDADSELSSLRFFKDVQEVWRLPKFSLQVFKVTVENLTRERSAHLLFVWTAT